MPTASAGFARRSDIPLFFALSLFAWVIWAPQAAHRLGAPVPYAPLQSPLNALTVWAPGLAALLLAARESGRAGAGALFRTLGLWRVSPLWFAVALLLEPLKWIAALGIDRLSGSAYELGPALLPRTFGPAQAYMIPVALLFTLPNALGEELGWRAFALPRLLRTKGALHASVLLGLFWGLWHVPSWIAWRTGEPAWLPILIMAVNLVPSAVVFTWLFLKTNGSLLLVCLYHASIASKGYLLPGLPTLTEAALLWALGIGIVLAGGLRPPRPPPAPALRGRLA